MAAQHRYCRQHATRGWWR